MKAYCILLAAGSGTRMQADRNKVLLKLEDQSAVIRCLKVFESTDQYDGIIVACRPNDRATIERKVAQHLRGNACRFCDGGRERQDSVRNALALIPADADYISVHDAARCFVTEDVIARSLASARKHGSGVAAVHIHDTVKRVEDGIVRQTLDRSALMSVQTPQTFAADLLRRAHQTAQERNWHATDDAALVERLGCPVYISEGSSENIKLTVRGDVQRGEDILRRRTAGSLRIGTGLDVHPFSSGCPLILGGVEIPAPAGLKGHSDADVLVHAVMDALLGAAGLPDIGVFYPPDDPAYRNIRSLLLLEDVGRRIRTEGFEIVNLDCTVLLEKPKLQPHIRRMIANIADALGILPEKVNIKATTAEKLGALGRGEGAAAQAVCLLEKEVPHV